MSVLSPTARQLYGAIWTFVTPRLGYDQRPPELSKILSDVTASNLSSKIPSIARRVRAQTRGRLAMDADLDDLDNMLGEFESEQEEAQGQEDNPLDAPAALEQFKRLLARLAPDEAGRFIELLQDMGALDPDGEPGGTINPYREGEDRRNRGAKDQPPAFPGVPRTNASERYGMDAAPSASFSRRFPSASRILIS